MSMNKALDSFKTYWSAHIETILAAIEAAESVAIPRIVSIDTAELKDRQYPSLAILPAETTTQYIHPEAPMDNEGFKMHNIALLFTMSGAEEDSPKKVQYALGWYQDALEDMLEDDNTFGGIFIGVKMGQTQWWPMVVSQQSGELLQTMRQNITIRTWHS